MDYTAHGVAKSWTQLSDFHFYCLSDAVLGTGNTRVDETHFLIRTPATEFKVLPPPPIQYDLMLVWLITCACMCAKLLQSCPALCDPMDCRPPGFSVFSPGKIAGVGGSALLQGIFLIQGSSPPFLGLWCWQAGSLPLATPGKPDYIRQAQYNCKDSNSNKVLFGGFGWGCFCGTLYRGLPGGSVVMNLPAIVGEAGWIPGSERSPG